MQSEGVRPRLLLYLAEVLASVLLHGELDPVDLPFVFLFHLRGGLRVDFLVKWFLLKVADVQLLILWILLPEGGGPCGCEGDGPRGCEGDGPAGEVGDPSVVDVPTSLVLVRSEVDVEASLFRAASPDPISWCWMGLLQNF